MTRHQTVLLHEAVEALVGSDQGLYMDGTFGRGGHSREILAKLGQQGRLLGFDKDPQAIAEGESLKRSDDRFDIAHTSFADVASVMAKKGVAGFDGILLDLGVSSPQLDQAERGFSFMRDGELDMRMNPEQGESAAQWLARAKEREIAQVLKDYGEERFAKRMARAVVTERQTQAITTTLHLAKVLADAHPAWEKNRHPATKAFQGIRIFINNELGDLQHFLDEVLDLLNVGGRLVVISFHSLEDRMVKRFMKRQAQGDQLPINVPVTEDQLNRRLKIVGKAIRAGQQELENNVRSRSAIMRVAEKIA